jgi:hypothetical protein
MKKLIDYLSPLYFGKELMEKLAVIPPYMDTKGMSQSQRLLELRRIYDIYLPNNMSLEIYTKLYMALVRSLEKKNTFISTQQQNENYKSFKSGVLPAGIIGGADSFSILGQSGIGKSASISHAIRVITSELITIEKPYQVIIPILMVQTPFDSSPKSLLIEITRLVDEKFGTNFYRGATRTNMTTDSLIGIVSNICMNHVGVLVVDELQHVVMNKSGSKLVRVLTQLINSSGVSICCVGTPELADFFKREAFLARRMLGIHYKSLAYDDYFKKLCQLIFRYQYTAIKTFLDEAMVNTLFEYSQGVISHLIALVVEAQELSILNNYERLDLSSLKGAFTRRMSMVSETLPERSKTSVKRINEDKFEVLPNKVELQIYDSPSLFQDISKEAKKNNIDVMYLLRGGVVPIIEVPL